MKLSVIVNSSITLELEPVDATAVLTNCLLGNYPLFEGKDIKPKTIIPDKAVMVNCNAHAMERIFQNLIQNALKFATQNIEITLTDEGVFTVSNDAPNLAASDVSHLFERFYIADKARTSGSSGIGLYIVKRLLEKTGGGIKEVSLESGKFTLVIYFSKVVVQ